MKGVHRVHSVELKRAVDRPRVADSLLLSLKQSRGTVNRKDAHSNVGNRSLCFKPQTEKAQQALPPDPRATVRNKLSPVDVAVAVVKQEREADASLDLNKKQLLN